MGDKIKFSKLSKAQQSIALNFDKDKNNKLTKQEVIDFKSSVVKENSTKPKDIAMDISLYLRLNKRSLSDDEFLKKFDKINKDNVIKVLDEFQKIDDGNSLFQKLLEENGDKGNRQKIFNKIVSCYLEKTGHKGKPSEAEVNNVVKRLCRKPIRLSRNKNLALLNAYMAPMKKENSDEIADGLYGIKSQNEKFINKPQFKVLMEKVNADNVETVLSKYKNRAENIDHTELIDDIENSGGRKAHRRAAIGTIMRAQIENMGLADNAKVQSSLQNSLDKEELDDVKNLMLVFKNRNNNQALAPMYIKLKDKSENDKEYAKFLRDSIEAKNIKSISENYEIQTGSNLVSDLGKNREVVTKILQSMQEDAKKVNNTTLSAYIERAIKKEDPDDMALLADVIYLNDDPEYMAETLASKIKESKKNLKKGYAQYLMDGINEQNVEKFLTKYKQKSGGVHFTNVLKNVGGRENKERLKNITRQLLKANSLIKEPDEELSEELGMFIQKYNVQASDVEKYAEKCTKDADDLKDFTDVFTSVSAEDIAENLINITNNNHGAPDKIVFKCAHANITRNNLADVFAACKAKTNGKTPINLIIEERGASKETRKKQIMDLYDLIAVKDDSSAQKRKEFEDVLNREFRFLHRASADKLNELFDKQLGVYEAKNKANKIISKLACEGFKPNRPKITQKKALGKKYGTYSWQYNNIKTVKTMEDVSRITGMSMEYLNFLKEKEGYNPNQYKCQAHHDTIGIGHDFQNAPANEKAYLNKGISEQEVYQILAYDLIKAIASVESKINDTAKLKQKELEALVDVAFNAGVGNMNTLCKCVNEAAQYRGTDNNKAQLLMYSAAYNFNQQFADGAISPGLCKRRVQDILMFGGITDFRNQLLRPNAEYQDFAKLSEVNSAKDRAIIQALNAYCTAEKKQDMLKTLCAELNISKEEFKNLEYPVGYECGDLCSKWRQLRNQI